MNILSRLIFYISSFVLAVLPVSTYTEGVIGQPRSLLPHQAVTHSDRTVSQLIFRGLFKYDIYGTLIPDLAETWAISDSGLVYTIKMRDNQFWSNGQKITADDLIYTSFKIPDLSGVATDKVDDLTVRFTLPNRFSPFLSLLTLGVMPANAEELYNPLTPVSSGPFRVLRIEKNGPIIRQITLLNENEDEKLKKLVFRYYSNEEELAIAAKLGEIDGFVSTEDFHLSNFNQHRYPMQGVYYALFFNLRNEKFADIEVRQKLERSLPISSLISDAGIPVQGSISRSAFTDEQIIFDKYEEGYTESLDNLSFSITVPDIEEHVNRAIQIKENWEAKHDVDINIISIDPEIFVEKIIKPRDFDVLLYGQEVGRDPDRYVNWHSTQKEGEGLNLSGFENVRSDRALEEGRKETDNDRRVVHYHEFQKVISDQTPAIFLYHPYFRYYVSKYIEGVGDKYTFGLTDRFLDFKNWHRVQTN